MESEIFSTCTEAAVKIERAAADISTLARMAEFSILSAYWHTHTEHPERVAVVRKFITEARAALDSLETLCTDEMAL